MDLNPAQEKDQSHKPNFTEMSARAFKYLKPILENMIHKKVSHIQTFSPHYSNSITSEMPELNLSQYSSSSGT
jgi:hypothetical protein